MGKRARRRGGPAPATASDWRPERSRRAPAASESDRPAPATATRRRRRARPEELPAPPWAPIPLVEILVFIGLVLMVAGFVAGGDRKAVVIGAGAALAALAGLEQALREHFAGFRSHSSLLAGVVAVLVLAGTSLAGLPRVAALVLAVVVGLLTFWRLRAMFVVRSGGFGFRA